MLEKTCHATGFAMLGKGWNSRQHFFLNKETTWDNHCLNANQKQAVNQKRRIPGSTCVAGSYKTSVPIVTGDGPADSLILNLNLATLPHCTQSLSWLHVLEVSMLQLLHFANSKLIKNWPWKKGFLFHASAFWTHRSFQAGDFAAACDLLPQVSSFELSSVKVPFGPVGKEDSWIEITSPQCG